MIPKNETVLHFVGIGGIGMSGIAEVFLNQGYQITGSDMTDSDITKRLFHLGATVRTGHHAANVRGASVVVISSAIRPDNPELLEAKRLRIPVIPRAEMLGELMRGKTGVAVAGTHGKTTTTSMIATVMTEAELDPTLVIGGRVDSFGGNAKLGRGQYVVAEADESDGSFLHLPATVGVITNIDNDHLDHFGSISAIEDAFVQFVGKLPFYGFAAVCGDDPGVRRCLHHFGKPFLTYGFSKECDITAENIQSTGLNSSFSVHFKGQNQGELTIRVPGRHNILNALGTYAICRHFDVSFEKIRKGLLAFGGVKRRFEICYEDTQGKRCIVDDYGHHPTEIAATLSAIRSYWKGRIVTVFQPHRYTRTLHCHDGFLSAFKDTDVLLVTDLYPAGEDPIEGVNSAALVADIARFAQPHQEILAIGDLSSAKAAALSRFRDGDLILCLGAGSITRLAGDLARTIKGGRR